MHQKAIDDLEGSKVEIARIQKQRENELVEFQRSQEEYKCRYNNELESIRKDLEVALGDRIEIIDKLKKLNAEINQNAS